MSENWEQEQIASAATPDEVQAATAAVEPAPKSVSEVDRFAGWKTKTLVRGDKKIQVFASPDCTLPSNLTIQEYWDSLP